MPGPRAPPPGLIISRAVPGCDRDAVAGQHVLLTIQRHMLGVLADQHIGQQAGRGQPALDGIGDRRRPRSRRPCSRSRRIWDRRAAGRPSRRGCIRAARTRPRRSAPSRRSHGEDGGSRGSYSLRLNGRIWRSRSGVLREKMIGSLFSSVLDRDGFRLIGPIGRRRDSARIGQDRGRGVRASPAMRGEDSARR